MATAARIVRLPTQAVLGLEVPVAVDVRSRLLGLALLDRADAGPGLLIPRCSSVHTCWMRFPLDIWFLDEEGGPLAVRRGVPPWRFARHRGATAVLELPAGEAGESAPPSPQAATGRIALCAGGRHQRSRPFALLPQIARLQVGSLSFRCSLIGEP